MWETRVWALSFLGAWRGRTGAPAPPKAPAKRNRLQRLWIPVQVLPPPPIAPSIIFSMRVTIAVTTLALERNG